MPRYARGHRFLGAILTVGWLSAGAAGAWQQADDPLAPRVAVESQAPFRAIPNGPPKPALLRDWGTEPFSQETSRASSEEILRALTPTLPTESRHTRPDQSAIEQAAKLAKQAAADRDNGNLAEASRLYRAALRMNPAEAKYWSELASVMEQQSNPIGAKSAYAEAIALGDNTFETLLHYGLLAADFREDRNAIAALLSAEALQEDHADAAAFVLSDALADTLARNGYIHAAVEHYTRLADLPASYTDPTPYRARLNEVYRNRRKSMWRAVELSHSIGDWDHLDRFLAIAEALPGPKHPQETAIRCYTLVRIGRPATAAAMLISTLGREPDAPETVDLLGYIAEHTDLGEEIDASLSRHAESMPLEQRQLIRQSLVLARAAVADRHDGPVPILLDHLREHPTDRAVWLELLRNDPASATTSLLEIHPCLEPEFTAVALELHGPIETDPASALGLRSALRRGDFSGATTTYLNAQAIPTDAWPRPEIRYTLLTIGVELLVDHYRGAEADRLLDVAIHDASSVSERLAVARALMFRNRHRDALSVLEHETITTSAPPGLVRCLIARAKLGLGDGSSALALVREALEEDPAEYDAAVLLIELGEFHDAAQVLRTVPAAEPHLLLVRAINAIQREQFDLADRLLREAWEHPLCPDDAANLLVSLLKNNGAIDAADAWLQQQIKHYPDRLSLMVLRSSLLRSDRRPEEALQLMLDARIIRQGSPTISREMESLLREDFESVDRWVSQARWRLMNAPNTFATFMERANVELAANKIEQAISLAELATDLAPSPTPTERHALNALLDGISKSIISQPRVQQTAIEGFVRIFERLDAPSEDAWKGRISIASIDRNSDEDGLIQLATQAAEALPKFGEEAFIHAARAVTVATSTGQSLLGKGEAKQAASTVFAAATHRLDPYPTRVLAAWIEFSQQQQDPFVLGEAIRSLGNNDDPKDHRLRDTLNHLVQGFSQSSSPAINKERLAESAFYLASQLSISDQFETAQVLYEEALQNMPEHAELNNDYGFRLLDRREQTDRAIRMIELAYAQNPNSSHIVDSMGWARYKQRQLTDEAQPGPGGLRLGAVSLLRRAKTLSFQEELTGLNACFTTDHLGDALWASGNHDEAVRQWTEAAELAEKAKKGIPNLPLSVEVELQELIDHTMEKTRAAAEDRIPAIAPMLD
ncbi:MAG: hypothetical protein ACIAQF_12970 [Phycisphaerales bacterium JB065]